ncbi:hypothetical protein AGLY_011902, partial [Aphis glycines]
TSITNISYLTIVKKYHENHNEVKKKKLSLKNIRKNISLQYYTYTIIYVYYIHMHNGVYIIIIVIKIKTFRYYRNVCPSLELSNNLNRKDYIMLNDEQKNRNFKTCLNKTNPIRYVKKDGPKSRTFSNKLPGKFIILFNFNFSYYKTYKNIRYRILLLASKCLKMLCHRNIMKTSFNNNIDKELVLCVLRFVESIEIDNLNFKDKLSIMDTQKLAYESRYGELLFISSEDKNEIVKTVEKNVIYFVCKEVTGLEKKMNNNNSRKLQSYIIIV